jgi:hypothetical protein
MSLTGRFDLKRTWLGRLALYVEENFQSVWGKEKSRWRRATLKDLAEPEMRTLIDLRSQRQFRRHPSIQIATLVQPTPMQDAVMALPRATREESEKRTEH